MHSLYNVVTADNGVCLPQSASGIPGAQGTPRNEEHRPPSAGVPRKLDCSAAGLHADRAGRTAASGVLSATHRSAPAGLSAVSAILAARGGYSLTWVQLALAGRSLRLRLTC